MDVFYVRNTRPNAVLVRLGERPHQVKYTVERRGSREDTTALPADARDDPIVARFLQQGIFEEISKDAFMTLGNRGDGRSSIQLITRKAEQEVAIPMGHMEESRTPTIIADKDIEVTKPWRSPRPEFAGKILSTEEELASGVIEPKDPEKKPVALSKDEKVDTKIHDLEAQLEAQKALTAEQNAKIDRLVSLLESQANVPATTESAENTSKYTRDELEGRTRNSLDGVARELGIKYPEKLQNKNAVIDEILQKSN